MSYLSGAKSSAKIIFRKIRGRIIPIAGKASVPSKERIASVGRKVAKHQAKKGKDVAKKSLISQSIKRIKKQRAIRTFRNRSVVTGGLLTAGGIAGYKEGRSLYLKDQR